MEEEASSERKDAPNREREFCPSLTIVPSFGEVREMLMEAS
jgi:hypothetical protein